MNSPRRERLHLQLPPLILDPSGVVNYGNGTLAFDAPNFRELPLSQFPLIEDFRVNAGETLRFGTSMQFESAAHGRLAGFWWDHVKSDQRLGPGWMPVGTFEDPFWDLDEGWEIAIGADEDFVYVVEGEFELEPRRFLRYFAVRRSEFETAWRRAVFELGGT